MNWRTWSDTLKAALHLSREPVAVAFTGEPKADTPSTTGKISVCQALQRASEGEALAITVETCGCPGGLVSLGLGQIPASGKERLVSFLVDKEKVYCSRAALHRGEETVPRPVGIGSTVLFMPLAKSPVLPDIVALIGTPGSLHQLLGYANYWEGSSLKAELAGPTCRTAIAYPLVTGEIGISLFDFGARRLASFEGSDLVLSVPFPRMLGIMAAIDVGVGQGRETDSGTVEREIDELGRVESV